MVPSTSVWVIAWPTWAVRPRRGPCRGLQGAFGTPVYFRRRCSISSRPRPWPYRAAATDDHATQHRLLKDFFMPYLAIRNRGAQAWSASSRRVRASSATVRPGPAAVDRPGPRPSRNSHGPDPHAGPAIAAATYPRRGLESDINAPVDPHASADNVAVVANDGPVAGTVVEGRWPALRDKVPLRATS